MKIAQGLFFLLVVVERISSTSVNKKLVPDRKDKDDKRPTRMTVLDPHAAYRSFIESPTVNVKSSALEYPTAYVKTSALEPQAFVGAPLDSHQAAYVLTSGYQTQGYQAQGYQPQVFQPQVDASQLLKSHETLALADTNAYSSALFSHGSLFAPTHNYGDISKLFSVKTKQPYYSYSK